METAGPESDSALVILFRAGKIFNNAGKQSDWGADPQCGINACKLIKDELKTLQAAVSAGLEQVRRAAILPVLESLRQFALDYAEERRRNGRAQFQDLLVWSRDLLKNNLEARRYFQRKYSHILIDEFQDTDPSRPRSPSCWRNRLSMRESWKRTGAK
jgi:ATP-dependent exoDNAse (exonuclease V) beta subunit